MSAAQTVSRNVRRLRRARGWMQAEAAQRFAEILGVPQSTASWSAGEQSNKPRQRAWMANELAALAELFGVAIGDLFDECCSKCEGEPPVGFTCNTCGTAGGAA
jgi:transcriptional regulator with XRE-family HTH domain